MRDSSAAVAALACHHLGERPWLEVQVTLDRQAKWAASTLQLGEDEVAPFVVHAADEPLRLLPKTEKTGSEQS